MKPSLPRVIKPSLLRKNRLPAVIGISNFPNFSNKYLRLFRERLINLFLLCKGDNQQQTIPAENNETSPAENNETNPVENNETTTVENNETIPVETEPLPSSHGYFKLSDLFLKCLRLFFENLLHLLFY